MNFITGQVELVYCQSQALRHLQHCSSYQLLPNNIVLTHNLVTLLCDDILYDYWIT